ncbi:MAG: hypothetical protein HY234_14630 [Acidobacteria bacterium]|nr:hypothetical protein [Acidobacteriota bacterium]MBI3664270.1 hypothetical protein [Acidobacteriota bacterium]
MTAPLEENKRRSSRVFIKLPVFVTGKNTDGRAFRETSETIVVNAHGALFYLQAPVAMESVVLVTNPATLEEQESRVVFIGSPSDHGQRIGVEFLTPAPRFWGVEFPPPDWPQKAISASSAPPPS